MGKKKSKAKKKVRRTAVRVTLGLEPRAHEIFVAAGGGEGKSAYISAVLRQRGRQWQQALEQLRAHGMPLLRRWVWALEYEWEQYDRGQSMARLARWGSEEGAQVPEESQLPALWILCAEWYAGNDALQQALEE